MISKVLLVVALGAVEGRLLNSRSAHSHNKNNNANSGLNFFILGDWGHNVPANVSESGVAFEQQIIADQMGIAGDQIKPSFIVAVGDNFYEAGPANTTDPIWQNYYRSVYTAPSTYVPWYPILGNHDYYIGGSPQAQIDYYYEQRDDRWTFPDYQYTKTWSVPGTSKTLEIVFINTVPLCPESSQDKIGWPNTTQAITLIWQPVAQWIKNALAASTADYLIVAGKQPSCKHFAAINCTHLFTFLQATIVCTRTEQPMMVSEVPSTPVLSRV